MASYTQIAQLIKKAKTISIICHINPDGDALGSLLGLGHALKDAKKTVYLVSPDGIPARYRGLPGVELIKRRYPYHTHVELALSVDCSSPQLLGHGLKQFLAAQKTVEIDHHAIRKQFADYQLIDSKAAAVGEMIYTLIKHLKISISPAIATNILTSIFVETDSFRLPHIRPMTFKVCEKLFIKNLNFYDIISKIYWTRSKSSVLLSGICLAKTNFLKQGKLAWTLISKKEIADVHGKDEDLDAVADEIRSIDHVQIAILFREKNSHLLRVSLRSKSGINVGMLAENYGGGGHYDVAGCFIPNNIRSINNLIADASKLIKA